MANQGGIRNRIAKITSRIRPGKAAVSPAKLNVDLKEAAIKPPSVPIRNQINRAKTGLKNQLGNQQKSVDGVRTGANKTLGQPEEEALREQQGLPPKTPPSNIPGGKAIKPSRTTPEGQEENVPEDDSSDEDSQIGQTGQQPPTPMPPEQEEQPPTQEPEPDDGGDGDGSDEKQGGPNIRNAIANKISNAIKKAAVQAGKKIATFFLTNPYAWLIVGIIIVVILGFLLFNYLMGTASQSPSSTGQSMTQAYDPAKDRSSLQAVLQLSGDKDAQQLNSWTLISGLQSDLTEMKNDAGLSTRPDKNQITGKIDAILGDIQTYSVAQDSKTGKKIIDGVKELWEMFGTLPPLVDAGSPLPRGSIVGYTNNLHDGTPMNPCPAKGCPAGHRTFYQSERNTCDAVDLKAKNGTPVYAAFGGKVIKKGGDGKNGQLVFIQNDAKYLAVYAHITGSTLNLNEMVKTGQQIGKVGSSHLHFELAQGGKCVTTTPQDISDAKINKKAPGYYLWQRMVKVLNNAV